ncbi:ferric reductase like transmembrane component [Amylocarpus encephaloides]|uniref:Ferric reductase like transmembrane component n=1 Tax=Amylocarpus encephaloides TaxID=45428 RepID=A0A9P7YCV2_9HELO|nr:ferric reductase like transmembrane component [Amylocarpus encephaloides]
MQRFFVVLILCIPFASAKIPAPNEFCFGACRLIFSTAQFNTTNLKTGESWGYGAPACRNELQIHSLYLCNRQFCSPEERDRGLAKWNETCRFWDLTLPPFSIVDSYTNEDLGHLHHLELDEVTWPVTIIWNEVVVPSEHLFHLALNTLDAAHFERRIHKLYGASMYYFWVVVILLGLSSRCARFLINLKGRPDVWQPLPTQEDTTPEIIHSRRGCSIFETLYTLLKRYMSVPATFGYTRSQNIWWCTIPTRIQSITIGSFIIINTVLCSISYRVVFTGNLYWPEVATQLCRYIADRTGVVSTANLALIWAFGIRNNTLMWLTGWDFATYNNFHRWVARVATVEAILHSVAYTIMIFGVWRVELMLDQATLAMAAICSFSVYPLRRGLYETFLQLHIVLSILVIVTMWYHVEIFNGEYNGYLWPCIFIWIFDRLVRILRVLSFNLKFWNTKATVTFDLTSNIVRVIVPYSTSFIQPLPGTFYYINALNDFRIWESHPFTLSYSTSSQEDISLDTYSTPPSSPGSNTPSRLRFSPQNSSNQKSSSELDNLLDRSQLAPPSSLVFTIRPYDGFTVQLRDSALANPATLRMLIEGPYGETQPLHTFENVLFMVGGTGIAIPLSYMDKQLAEDSNTTSLHIVWAVREQQFLADTITTDFRGAVEDKRVSVAVFVTQPDKDEQFSCLPKMVEVHHGRPNVYGVVEEAARRSCHTPLAVVACGPGQMTDDTRKAVVQMLGKGYGKIEYFEESFNW